MSKMKNTNALKHGAFSEMVLLPGEDREEFDALHQALREEWDPQGPTEEDKISNIALNIWRKRRIDRYRRGLTKPGEKILQTENFDLEKFSAFLDDARAGKPMSELKLPAWWATRMKKDFPREKYESEDAWRQVVVDTVGELWEIMIDDRGKFTHERFVDPFCDPKVIAEDIAFEERLDAKIDKDIVALGKIKTMQAMGLGRRHVVLDQSTTKEVSSSPIQSEGKTAKEK